MATPEKARAFWNDQASGYDRRSAWLERRALGAGRRWACQRAMGETLDVGIGTGANLPHYPADVRVTGIDWSESMVELARQRAQEIGRPVTVQQGDAGELAFPDASFDTVLSTYVLCCVPDERRALDEAVRVLRPAGRLLLVDHIPSTNPGVRLGQALLEKVTVRANGEHMLRRPADLVRADPRLEVVESNRRTMGIIEQVYARRRS